MLRRVTLALVAAASLSAMALAPTAASAGPWGGGWGGNHHNGGHDFGSIGRGIYSRCFVNSLYETPLGARGHTVNVCVN